MQTIQLTLFRELFQYCRFDEFGDFEQLSCTEMVVHVVVLGLARLTK